MSWRTARQAAAAMRREMRYRRGGRILIHGPRCGLHYDARHDCRLRLQIVRPR